MTKPNYRTPFQAHQSRRDLPPGGKEYFAQLIKAKSEPEKHGMPICYRHIEDLAQSISRRELTDSVIVLVEPGLSEPGLADPDRVNPNMFCCFLCQRDGA